MPVSWSATGGGTKYVHFKWGFGRPARKCGLLPAGRPAAAGQPPNIVRRAGAGACGHFALASAARSQPIL
ncbi:MAG: hypothetical protein DWG81_03315 [Chloroflexi bacterium]|nr:hypothetical protein [Chloroflexota bacterium]